MPRGDKRKVGVRVGASVLLLGAIGLLIWHLHVRRLEDALLRADPDVAVSDPGLRAFALARAPAVYGRHCASCHGSELHGNQALGAPDLSDGNWLYGSGDLPDIENTLNYGIRSGHPKSHNITDMPALGRIGQLSAAEIQDVVEFVYAFSHADVNNEAALRGRALFKDKGNCYDCHAPDGTGNIDYGAPDLSGHSGWLYGGDRQTLFASVYNGRHGQCPAWITRLSAIQIRELALYLYSTAHRATHDPTAAAGAT